MIRKNTIFIGISGLIMALLSIAASTYLFSSIKEKNERVAGLHEANSQAAAKDEKYKALRDILKDTLADRQIVESHVVSKEGVVDFVEDIEELATLSRVELNIKSLDQGEWGSEKNSELGALVLNMTVKGSWAAAYGFVSRLEEMPYLAIVDQLQLEKMFPKEKDSAWQATVRFKVLKEK